MESQLENVNKLEQINKEAAERASAALSKLIDRSVEIGISKAQVKKVENISPLIGNEEVVAGIYLPVTGEINGAALLIFPRETAFILSDLLVKRPPGTTRKLTKLDESALKEVGNIITGVYLTALHDFCGVNIYPSIPCVAVDMINSILDESLVRLSAQLQSTFLIENRFIIDEKKIRTFLLIIPSMGSIDTLVGSIEQARMRAVDYDGRG